jgi:penicillin-binding protein 1C
MLIDDLPLQAGSYQPRNFDGAYHGRLTIREALQQSLNIPAIAVAQRLGPQRFATALRRAGATLRLPGSGAARLPIVLGGVGMTLADLGQLYATVADGGMAKPLRYTKDAPIVEGTPFLSAATSRSLAAILVDAPRPDGIAATVASARQIAYKTGTSYGFRDAWAAGFSPRHTVVVWVGRADGTPRPGTLGRDAAAPLLFKLFDLLPETGTRFDESATGKQQAPVNLRRFEAAKEPRILFPENGAVIALQPGDAGAFRPLPLKAEGGSLPRRWLVNGVPVTADALRNTVYWQPDGEGFVRIVVLDGDDRSATAVIRLK